LAPSAGRIRLSALATDDDLQELFIKADEAGFALDDSFVLGLLSLFEDSYRPDRVTDLFSCLRWPKYDAPPDHIGLSLPPPSRAVYLSMIRFFCRAGRWPVALSLLKRMQSRAQPFLDRWQLESITPSRPCYTSVVEGCVAADAMPEALSVVGVTCHVSWGDRGWGSLGS
jgi:pentatricopeptide repeat protein